MFLQIMTDAGNVGGYLNRVSQPIRAILRRAEFGFFGVVVLTTVHTPRLCGAAIKRRRVGFVLNRLSGLSD
jgi:hypothetical protein